MIKILIVVGTRPEAIKLAPLIRCLKNSTEFDARICSTSQHREMLDQVMDFFQIKSDFDLHVMEPNQTLPVLTSKILLKFSAVLKNFNPDWVVVQGDTTTAMAGAMAAFYERKKIAHVEAGLRSHNLYSPFPEEMNRNVISKIAYCHFCPTHGSVQNLLMEGVSDRVYQVGNTVVDAAQEGMERIKKMDQKVFTDFFKMVDFTKKIILVTCHRRESFGEPFVEICDALVQLVNSNKECEIVYPVHLNPNIRAIATNRLKHPAIKLLDPVTYPQLLWLMSKCKIILTDSGGIQEEAPTFHKPVLVLRKVTERMEGIEAGTALLVGTKRENIVEESIKLLENGSHYQNMTASTNPYGDGHASLRMTEIIKNLS